MIAKNRLTAALRVPRDIVVKVACPRCGSAADEFCLDSTGQPHRANHIEGVKAAIAAMQEQTSGDIQASAAELSIRDAYSVSRDVVQKIACPQCTAPQGTQSRGRHGQLRLANHIERIRATLIAEWRLTYA